MDTSPVTHVRYVAYAVPDYQAEVAFYTGIWGLTETHTDTGLAFLAAEGSPEQYVVRLRQSAHKHLDLMALAVADQATVDRLAAEFMAAGVRIDREPGTLKTPGGGYGFRCFDPDGRLVEVSADVEERQARQLDERESIPQGLSHIVINSPDLHATMAFYVDRFGMVLSDWLGDFMCFLRIGLPHHVMAITQAPHASFNHAAFEIRGVEEYIRGTGRMIRGGMSPVWGPGRHGPGDNTFSYFLDPNGIVAEYTFGLEQMTEPVREPRVWGTSPEENDQWGTANPFEEYLPYAINQPDPQL